MSTEVTLRTAVEALNTGAVGEFHAALVRYSEDLMREASRLEAVSNTTGKPEITGSMVRDADLLLRKGYRNRAKSRLLSWAQVLGPSSGVITGLLFDRQSLQQPLNLVAFVVFLTLTLGATIFCSLKE